MFVLFRIGVLVKRCSVIDEYAFVLYLSSGAPKITITKLAENEMFISNVMVKSLCESSKERRAQ